MNAIEALAKPALAGRNCFLTGMVGIGKSTLLRALVGALALLRQGR
jgi:ABC-type transport system involved in cytochrome c biogenesis ATPase subunit